MSTDTSLIERAFEALEPGEVLFITGGTFPGQNESANIEVGLKNVVHVQWLVSQTPEKPPRTIPVAEEVGVESVEVELNRGEKRFGFDPDDMWFRYGKGVGEIAGIGVDVVIVDGDRASAYFIGPSTA